LGNSLFELLSRQGLVKHHIDPSAVGRFVILALALGGNHDAWQLLFRLPGLERFGELNTRDLRHIQVGEDEVGFDVLQLAQCCAPQL
jgi:hypothetical protein